MVDFQVLRCYACGTFQVHQVKSSSKFTCKMCGEKQSVKKVYAVSSGKDCRMIVQQLNRSQGEKHDQRAAGTSDDGSSKDDDDDDCGGNAADREPDVCGDVDAERSTLSSGRWARFVDSTAPCEDADNDEEAESVTLNQSEWMGCRRQGRSLTRVRRRQGPKKDEETLPHIAKRNRTLTAWTPCANDTICPQGKINLPFLQATVDPLCSHEKTDMTYSQDQGNSVHIQDKIEYICNQENTGAVFPQGKIDTVSSQSKIYFNQEKTYPLAPQGKSNFCPQSNTDQMFPHQKVVSMCSQEKNSSVFLQNSKHVTLFQTDDDFDEDF
uniref:MRN complex-interacting protein isoform X1 n=1 Tax=Petromyzon marinus TaxID=7757 RepID=A0AAJ7U8T6_PETMA|nr:MRN complex-interacting protein isoform X1 [Petromyzon marinus]